MALNLCNYGFIPACTGTLKGISILSRLTGVHPRVYGDAERDKHTLTLNRGSSPHVRGRSTAGSKGPGALAGFIPACTGTLNGRKGEGATYWGSSPHVRGRSGFGGVDISHLGSISACTGTLDVAQRLGDQEGFIPACTGTLASLPPSVNESWVHPRVYGDARTTPSRTISPLGFIPACTGTLKKKDRAEAELGFIPRVYGDTRRRLECFLAAMGSSPHVRGRSIAGFSGMA